MQIKDQVAFVTGAGQGIGRAAALKLAEAGATVVAVDINPKTAEDTASAVAALGRQSLALAADLGNVADIDRAFDAAVAKVCEKMEGPLIDEFEVVAREIRVGETRRQALRNLGDRVESDDLRSFARSIIQADELGTSLGRTLKVQADDMRVHRQLSAEEKAMKAPVKMLFPTVIFIFPAMFIVILGPAFLNIMSSLANAT